MPKAHPKVYKEEINPVVADSIAKLKHLNPEIRENMLLAMREDYTNLIKDRKARVSEVFSFTRNQFKQIFNEVEYEVRNTFEDVARSIKRPLKKVARAVEH